MQEQKSASYDMAALFTLSIRLVVGWTYFSAFWRRLVLENKLDPDSAGYVGEKFNHFLPNALGIQDMIEYLVSHPDTLWWAMTIFTIVEAIVGLFIMLGLFTRLMSIGVFSLALGILLGSGWLGTTCLDEWQIGILGVAAGFTLFLSGSGPYSVDHWLRKKNVPFTVGKWFAWIGSGNLPFSGSTVKRLSFSGAVVIFGLTLFTNQYFHGGVWGTLHNKSVKPEVRISDVQLSGKELSFEVFRIEGVDVYGSFLIGVSLADEAGNTVFELNGEDLADFPPGQIHNQYVAKVKPGKHSLILPLGARATISVRDAQLDALPAGNYLLKLTDISGATWEHSVRY